jgi:hypothetical protein
MKKLTTISAMSFLIVCGAFALPAESQNRIRIQTNELIAMHEERVIDLGQIPMTVSNSLREKYNQYRIGLFVTEVIHDGEKFYYVTAESKSKILTLKCLTNGEILVEKKVRKKDDC